jgi:hypothetical protein
MNLELPFAILGEFLELILHRGQSSDDHFFSSGR